MITIHLTPERLEVDGHARFAAPGHDIVCAAVSALTVNLINSINALTPDRVQADVGDGHTELEIGNLSEGARLLVDSFFIGVSSVADEYPECVRII